MNNNIEQEIINELRYSVPNKRILEVTTNLAVRHPKTNELIFLKQRPTLEDIHLSEYIEYNEVHEINYSYSELFGKSVIIDKSLLGYRGKKALEKL
jgi:hypothetical protein